MKLRLFRYIILVLLVLGVIVSPVYDIPKKFIMFSAGLFLLFFEGYDAYFLRQKKNKFRLFKVRSKEWIGSVVRAVVLIYFFYEQPLNFWNAGGLASISLYGIMEAFRMRFSYYELSENGIKELNTDTQKVEAAKVTEIKITDEELAVDTTKYQNDFVIKTKDLVSPDWEELKTELKSKSWGKPAHV